MRKTLDASGKVTTSGNSRVKHLRNKRPVNKSSRRNAKLSLSKSQE